MRALTLLSTLAPLALASTARADAELPPVPPEERWWDPPPPARRWLARPMLGVRHVSGSKQNDLLALDGYSAEIRFVAAGEFSWFLAPAFAVTGFIDFSHRQSRGEGGGPTMREPV